VVGSSKTTAAGTPAGSVPEPSVTMPPLPRRAAPVSRAQIGPDLSGIGTHRHGMS